MAAYQDYATELLPGGEVSVPPVLRCDAPHKEAVVKDAILNMVCRLHGYEPRPKDGP